MPGRETINSFLYTLFGFKRSRKKSHLLLIILIHISCWCLLFLLPVLLYPVRINDRWFIIREMIDKSVLVILFYLNYYLFIPRFFEKKKYLVYTALVMLSFLFYLVQNVSVRFKAMEMRGGPFQIISFNEDLRQGRDSVFARNPGIPMPLPPDRVIYFDSTRGGPVTDSFARVIAGRFPLPPSSVFGIPRGALAMSLNNAISSFALLLLLGGFIRLAYSFIRNQNEKKVLENANLNAEVNFLKSQINPHFLFNTLNSIYSQAHARSVNTEFSILKLSELLRYVLYDSGEEKVELQKDIHYINNYIDLQRLRLSNRIQLNYEVSGDLQGKMIAPLLLICFIENAFKHGISYAQPSVIDIKIMVFEKTLTLYVTNPIVETDSFAPGGLGLKNVQRRLELLYPGQHQLAISHQDDLYTVNLKLEFNHA